MLATYTGADRSSSCIDRLIVAAGLAITNTSGGLVSPVWVHSHGVITRPLELLPRWVPGLLEALHHNTKVDTMLTLRSTAAAHEAATHVDALATQVLSLVRDHNFSGVNVDYEARCCMGKASGVCECDASEAAFLIDAASTRRCIARCW